MITITKPQRKAVKRIYDRCRLDINADRIDPGGPFTPISYREYREKIQLEIGGGGAVFVHWCNMWLGIETDGHTHS
jgi:hypothetical protein